MNRRTFGLGVFAAIVARMTAASPVPAPHTTFLKDALFPEVAKNYGPAGFVPLSHYGAEIGRYESFRVINTITRYNEEWLHPSRALRNLLAASPARRRWVLAYRHWREDGKPLLTPRQIYRSYREPSKELYGLTL